MSWPAFWTTKTWQTLALLPLSKLVCWEAMRRLKRFESNSVRQAPIVSTAKVIVVGNVVVGGSGKTPFIIWLTKQLQAKGLTVGIISRGYGGQSKNWPRLVTDKSDPNEVGDEPVLLAKQLGCAIAVSPKRVEAIALLNQTVHKDALGQIMPFDVIISDDGLQHYAMARDIEIVLIDSQRQFGNELCLPAGPLREPINRINKVDFCIWNGLEPEQAFPRPKTLQKIRQYTHFRMALQPVCFRQVKSPDVMQPVAFFAELSAEQSEHKINAIAGIGNPNRFFETLQSVNISANQTVFADHYAYQLKDFEGFSDEKPLLMTEKDAVKCSQMAQEHQKTNWWYLEVAPICDERLLTQLMSRLTS